MENDWNQPLVKTETAWNQPLIKRKLNTVDFELQKFGGVLGLPLVGTIEQEKLIYT